MNIVGEISTGEQAKFLLGIFDKPGTGIVFSKPFCDLGDCLRRMTEKDVIASLTSCGKPCMGAFSFSGNAVRSGGVRGGLFFIGNALLYCDEHDLRFSAAPIEGEYVSIQVGFF